MFLVFWQVFEEIHRWVFFFCWIWLVSNELHTYLVLSFKGASVKTKIYQPFCLLCQCSRLERENPHTSKKAYIENTHYFPSFWKNCRRKRWIYERIFICSLCNIVRSQFWDSEHLYSCTTAPLLLNVHCSALAAPAAAAAAVAAAAAAATANEFHLDGLHTAME